MDYNPYSTAYRRLDVESDGNHSKVTVKRARMSTNQTVTKVLNQNCNNLSAQYRKATFNSSSRSQKETSNIRSTNQSTYHEFAPRTYTNQSSLSSTFKHNEFDQQTYEGSDMDLSDTDDGGDCNLIEIKGARSLEEVNSMVLSKIEKETIRKMVAISTSSNTGMITPMESVSSFDRLASKKKKKESKSKATKNETNQTEEIDTFFSTNSSSGTNSSSSTNSSSGTNSPVKCSTNDTKQFNESLIKTNQTFQVIYSSVNNHGSCFSRDFLPLYNRIEMNSPTFVN